MKTPSRLLTTVLLCVFAPHLHAAVVVSRAMDYTTAVPITTLNAASLDVSGRDVLDHLKSLPSLQPPAGDLAELKKHPPFNALPNDQAVGDRLNMISSLAIDAVEVIRRGDSSIGDALAFILNNRRMNLAFGGMPGADAEIRDDGSARYGTENLNLHWVPQPLAGQTKINLYDIDGIRFTYSLRGLGNYMTLPGYEGKPPQTTAESIVWALTNQNRSLTAGSNTVDQLDKAILVFSGIVSNLALPTNSQGIARSLGRMLLDEPSLTDPAKQQKARDALAYLQGELLPKEQWNLSARGFYRDTLDLTRLGKLSSLNGYNEPFKKAGYFFDTVRKPGTTYPYTSYFGGYASVANPATTPTLVFDNRFWRVTGKSDGTKETETITVPELGGITLGGFDGSRLYIGGPNTGFSQFICYGYHDSNGDGRIEPDTKRQLFTSANFINGAHLAWNPANGSGIVLDRATRNLYQFTGSGADGFATGTALKGTFGNDKTDLWRLGISFNGNWAGGYADFAGTLGRYYQHSESYLDTGTAQYKAMRVGYSYDEYRQNAAAAGPITPADQPWRFTGSSDTEYTVFFDEMGVWTPKATATTDPNGAGFFYIPGTETVLKIGGRVRFALADGSEASPDYTVTEPKPHPELFSPKLRYGDRLSLSVSYQPDTSVTLERGTSYADFTPVETTTTSAFGLGSFSDCLPEPILSFYVWRALASSAQTVGVQDYYYLPPGVRRTLYPGWNDRVSFRDRFTLDNPAGLAASIMIGVTMDPVTSAFLGTVATFSNNPLAYRIYQNNVFLAAYQTVIIPDVKRLLNPPINIDSNGDFYVPVRCLVIGGKAYPMMQFRLAYPDNCADAHWHGNRVYHVDNDTVGIIDPAPTSCGFGSYLAVPQTEVNMPFAYWLLYRAYFLGLPLGSPQITLNEAVCAPPTVKQ